MSAPSVACDLADALAPILTGIERAMECHAVISRLNVGDRIMWVAVVHDYDRAFQGIEDTPSRALMTANGERQSYGEALAKNVA